MKHAKTRRERKALVRLRPSRLIPAAFCAGSAAPLDNQLWFSVSVEVDGGCVCQQPVWLCLDHDSHLKECKQSEQLLYTQARCPERPARPSSGTRLWPLMVV